MVSPLPWTSTAASTPFSCSRSAVPKRLWHEEEDEEETEADYDGDNPEDPSPAQRLVDGSAYKGDEILAAQK